MSEKSMRVSSRISACWKSCLERCLLLRSAFQGDSRGATAVQALVMMPVFIIAMITMIELWKVVMVRRTLHTGTYLATRYLSLYPPTSPNPSDWSDIARQIISDHLRNSPFVGRLELLNPTYLEVFVDGGNVECKARFTVSSRYSLRIPTVAPFPGRPRLDLRELREGEILCN